MGENGSFSPAQRFLNTFSRSTTYTDLEKRKMGHWRISGSFSSGSSEWNTGGESATILSKVELGIYAALTVPTLYVAVKHGRRGLPGWLFLLLFCALRVTGGAMSIAKLPSAVIVSSIGLSPLLLAIAGVYHEAYVLALNTVRFLGGWSADGMIDWTGTAHTISGHRKRRRGSPAGSSSSTSWWPRASRFSPPASRGSNRPRLPPWTAPSSSSGSVSSLRLGSCCPFASGTSSGRRRLTWKRTSSPSRQWW